MLYHFKAGLLISIFFLYSLATNADEKLENLVKREFIDDNYFILEVKVSNIETAQILEAYKTSYGFYISLEELIEILLFKIDFDYNTHNAKGWYLKEENKFFLDFAKKIIKSKGNEYNIKPEWIFAYNNEVYVNINVVNQIFPLSLKVDFPKLVLQVNSGLKLPIMLIEERKGKKKFLNKDNQNDKFKYEYISDNYRFLTFPITEINASLEESYKKNEDFEISELKNKLNYDVIASNHMLWMNSNIFSSGKTKQLEELRLKLSRTSENADLLGKLGASQLFVGDIDETAGSGKGVRVTNNSLERGNSFSNTIISGDSLPGWDIELYQNDNLLDIITVGKDGKYSFTPKLYYGNNIFEIVQYGPYGEIKREIRKFNIGENILKNNKLNYDLQLIENNNSVFNINHKNTTKNPNMLLKLGKKIGVKSTIYAEASKITESLDLKEKDKFDYNMSYLTTHNSLQSNFSIKTDKENKGAEYTVENHFELFDENTAKVRFKPFGITGNKAEYGAEFDFTRNIDLMKLQGVNLTIESIYYRREYGSYNDHVDASIEGQKSFGNVNATQKFAILQQESKEITAMTRFVKKIAKFSNTATFNYQIDPKVHMTEITISNNYAKKLRYGLEMNFTFNSYFPVEGHKDYSADASFRKQINKFFNYDFFIRYSRLDEFGFGVNFNFDSKSLLFLEPHQKKIKVNQKYSADNPLVSVLSYLDDNNNGFYEEDETVLPDIGFFIRNKKTEIGDKNGISIGGDITDGVVYDLFPDYETLEDPEIVPKEQSIKILAQAGRVLKISYPFIKVGSIDGNLHQNGKTLSHVKVVLYSENHTEIASYVADDEGFFFLPDIPVGNYYLSLSKTSIRRLRLKEVPKFDISVTNEKLFHEYLKFDLGKYIPNQNIKVKDNLENMSPDTQLKLDFVDPEMVERLYKIIPKESPLPEYLRSIRIKAKPKKLIDYFEESYVDGKKYLSFYEVQIGSFKYYDKTIDLRNILRQQAEYLLKDKHMRVIRNHQKDKEASFLILKIDALHNKSNADNFCKEIKRKLKIDCKVYQEVLIDKIFYSKEQIKIFWEYLKSCKKRLIKSSDEYFIEKILDNKGNPQYKMKIISNHNKQRNLRKVCSMVNQEKTICRVRSNIKLSEAFSEEDYNKKFNHITNMLDEYMGFAKIKHDEFDVGAEDGVRYNLRIGKFVNYLSAERFCRSIQIKRPGLCYPVKRTESLKQITYEMNQ